MSTNAFQMAALRAGVRGVLGGVRPHVLEPQIQNVGGSAPHHEPLPLVTWDDRIRGGDLFSQTPPGSLDPLGQFWHPQSPPTSPVPLNLPMLTPSLHRPAAPALPTAIDYTLCPHLQFWTPHFFRHRGPALPHPHSALLSPRPPSSPG